MIIKILVLGSAPVVPFFSAEFVAIYEALKNFLQQSLTNFKINSDSLSALVTFLPSSSAHPILHDIIALKHHLVRSGYNVLLCWTPNPTGIAGYEHANEVPKQTHTDLHIPLHFQKIKLEIKILTRSNWREHWTLQIHNKLLLPNILHPVRLQ